MKTRSSKGNCSISSPMPWTRACPPTTQNATSAPSDAAATGSLWPAQWRIAAASAEPPPSPAPAAITFSIRTLTSLPTYRSARDTRLSGPRCSSFPSESTNSTTGDSASVTKSQSPKSSDTMSASMRWKPSLRLPTTRSEVVSLAGAKSRKIPSDMSPIESRLGVYRSG